MRNHYKPRDRQFMAVEGKRDSGVPQQPEPSSESFTFRQKAFKDLRYGLIATKADPTTDASVSSQPYAIIASTNSVIGGNYSGEQNLTGNVMPQLLISNKSKLVNNFDSGVLKLKLNYLYLNLDDRTKPNAVNKYMGVAINEALSKTNAEMLTLLPFSTDKVVVEASVPTADAGNKLYVLVLYQSLLQNAAAVLAKYTQLMSLEQPLIDMGFNRECNFTQEIFALFKKKAFVAKMQSLATTLNGEYFDVDWFKQINTLTMIPSKKSNSVRDPLLTAVATHKLPKVTVFRGDAQIISTDSFSIEVTTSRNAGSSVLTKLRSLSGEVSKTKSVKATEKLTQDQVCEHIIELFDQRSILEWARQKFSQIGNVPSPQEYYNEVIDYLGFLTSIMAKVSDLFSDMRTYLDVMNKIGLNQWKVGTRFDMSAVSKSPLMFNKIISDVFAAYLNAPDKITFSSTTQRWTMYTLWNEYTGINDYDQFVGGSFLAFSLRSIVMPSDVPADDAIFLVPKLFDVTTNSVLFTARSGFTTTFSYDNMSDSEVKGSHILSRLVPLSSMSVDIRMPKTSVLSAGDLPTASSAAYEIMQTVFGYGKVEVSPNVWNYALGRDLVSFIDVQLADVNNGMLTFIRAFAPFRVWTLSGNREIGFGS